MRAVENRHPLFLFVFFASVIVFTVFSVDPVFQVLSLVGGLLFGSFLHGAKKTAKDVVFYLLIILVITVTNPLFSHNGVTPLFFMNGKAITLEALCCGANLGVTVAAVIVWFGCMNAVMTSDKTLYLFGKTVPKLSLIISMSLRFIPEFIEKKNKVSRARKATGAYSQRSFADRLRSAASVYASTVSWSLESSVDTSVSMKARGYGLRGRTSYFPYRFRTSDLILIVVCLSLLVLSFTGTIAGDTEFYFYPRISEIKITPFSLISYISFALLAFLPFILEVKEAVVWKYCVSKI